MHTHPHTVVQCLTIYISNTEYYLLFQNEATQLLDRPTGTTKKQHLVAHSTQPSPVRARSVRLHTANTCTHTHTHTHTHMHMHTRTHTGWVIRFTRHASLQNMISHAKHTKCIQFKLQAHSCCSLLNASYTSSLRPHTLVA